MNEMEQLPFGPLDARALHVCIDMQRIFLEPGPWYGEACLSVFEPQKRLIDHAPARALFTRFITAHVAGDATGSWQRYYRHWQTVTQVEAGPEILDLHPNILPLAHPENVFDKLTHDAFDSKDFSIRIAAEAPSALILSGIETDVCVLATAMSAVDLGYRTVIATDGVASSTPASHAATMEHVYPRFDQQIELVSVDTIIRNWRVT
jgi:nicotinamidase-related amidase